jgi:hypothetical protein
MLLCILSDFDFLLLNSTGAVNLAVPVSASSGCILGKLGSWEGDEQMRENTEGCRPDIRDRLDIILLRAV